jgi:hypothetical protein
MKARMGLNGQKWRQTHQSTVDSVLSAMDEHVEVRSQGTMFYNKDNWTARSFAAAMCEWAKLNPGKAPTESDVSDWINKRVEEHSSDSYERRINIAATPDDLPRWLAMALVGGGYHEAWHTRYSCRRRLTVGEMWPHVERLWKLVPYEPERGRRGWAGLTRYLLDWGNIIEDIRIERCGCKAYPGSPGKMGALQDLILKQEEEGRSVSEHRGIPVNDDLSVVVGTFRDLGLGYTTHAQLKTLAEYSKRSPEGYAFVTSGPLKPLLKRAMEMSAEDDIGHLWLAMEVIAAIVEVSPDTQEPAPPPGPTDPPPPGGGGEDSPPVGVRPNDEGTSEGGGGGGKTYMLYQVGDRATLKSGEHKGQEVEVVWAGLPDRVTGKQELSYSLVVD